MRYFLLAIMVVLAISSCDMIKASQLENSVLKALADDPRTSSFAFEVSLQEGGEILITGEVSNDEQVAAVGEIAASVKGVGKVLNRVHVPQPGSNIMQDDVVPSPFM